MDVLNKFASTVPLSLTAFASQVPSAQDITIAVVPKVAEPFFDDTNTGAAEAAGVNYQWVVPQITRGATQVKIMEDLIARQVDGIAISVNEPKSVERIIQSTVDQVIKVLTVDSDSAGSGRSMYIGTIDKQAGVTMGEEMDEALCGSGKVAIWTCRASVPVTVLI